MNIIPRKQWGARPGRGFVTSIWPPGVTLHVHHTVTPAPPDDPQAEAAAVRSVQRIHMDGNGWSDIGYSYLVAPSGRVYEGRGRNVRGAHSPTKNHEPSVALIGDYSTIEPTDAQLQAVWDLADHIDAGRLAGHRDSHPTACPGDAAYRKIVKGPRPTDPGDKPTGQPLWNTLRLVLRPEGRPARQWSGKAAKGPIVWIARNGVAPGTDVALAYNGRVYRDPIDARNVARNLTRRFFS